MVLVIQFVIDLFVFVVFLVVSVVADKDNHIDLFFLFSFLLFKDIQLFLLEFPVAD